MATIGGKLDTLGGDIAHGVKTAGQAVGKAIKPFFSWQGVGVPPGKPSAAPPISPEVSDFLGKAAGKYKPQTAATATVPPGSPQVAPSQPPGSPQVAPTKPPAVAQPLPAGKPVPKPRPQAKPQPNPLQSVGIPLNVGAKRQPPQEPTAEAMVPAKPKPPKPAQAAHARPAKPGQPIRQQTHEEVLGQLHKSLSRILAQQKAEREAQKAEKEKKKRKRQAANPFTTPPPKVHEFATSFDMKHHLGTVRGLAIYEVPSGMNVDDAPDSEVWVEAAMPVERKKIAIYQMVRYRIHQRSTSTDPVVEKLNRMLREAIDAAREPVWYGASADREFSKTTVPPVVGAATPDLLPGKRPRDPKKPLRFVDATLPADSKTLPLDHQSVFNQAAKHFFGQGAVKYGALDVASGITTALGAATEANKAKAAEHRQKQQERYEGVGQELAAMRRQSEEASAQEGVGQQAANLNYAAKGGEKRSKLTSGMAADFIRAYRSQLA
jgi:hypothetical protein